jgi:N-acetylmuramoyl-L-alanine amidase
MPLNKLDNENEQRDSILRSLYEENLRIAGKATTACSTRTRQIAAATRRWPLLLALLTAVPAYWYSRPSVLSERPAAPIISKATTDDADAARAVGETPKPHLIPGVQVASIEDLLQIEPIPEVQYRAPDYTQLLYNTNIQIKTLFGLEVKTIVIDAGHGGRDPGASGAMGTMEKDITLDIALRLRDRLAKQGGYRILLTRDRDQTVPLKKRVEFANAHSADLFISIHVNSLPQKVVNLVETYYFGPTTDAQTVQLAEQENKGSEYRVGDFKEIIQGIGNTMKWQESSVLAASIQHSLFRHIRESDKDVVNVGTKTAPFVVLLGVDSPSVLAEVTCITNKEEEAKLRSQRYREKIASFLEEGIITYLNQKQIHADGDTEYGNQTVSGS